MSLREILRTFQGMLFGQDDVGNIVSNRIDGSQFVLQTDDNGVPSIETTTAEGVTTTYQIGSSTASPVKFNDYLTPEQDADTKSETPSVNLTTVFHDLQDQLLAQFSTPTLGNNNSMGFAIEFDAGGYVFDYLDVWPGVTLRGANRQETRFLQPDDADRDFCVVLARNGYTTRSRSANAIFENITFQGNGIMEGDVGFIAEMHGVSVAAPGTDPDHDPDKNYNSFTMNNCSVLNFSGDGVQNKLRGRADCSNVRSQGNGGHGFNCQGPDCIYDHCAGGNNDMDTFFAQGASTPRLVNCELWASNNDADGYVVVHFDRCREEFVLGGDINGPILIEGAQGDPEDGMYGYWAKALILGVDLKFRASNFTDNDDGEPYPVDGYVMVSGFRHVDVVNCIFTPAYDRDTNEFTYRPRYGISTTGQASINLTCSLPPLLDADLSDHGLWPFGPAVGEGSNSIEDIISNHARAHVTAVYPPVEGDQPVAFMSQLGGLYSEILPIVGMTEQEGAMNIPKVNMTGNVIDVTKMRNSLTLTDNETLTFSDDTPDNGRHCGMRVKAQGADYTVTLPADIIDGLTNEPVASFVVLDGNSHKIIFEYAETQWFIYGHPTPTVFQNLAADSSYADDAAAAGGGKEIGDPYRTGSAVKVRVA